MVVFQRASSPKGTNDMQSKKMFSLPKNPHIRTNAETWAEIERLYSLIDRVPSDNAFGDSNRAAIRAQTVVLDKRLTLDEVLEQYGEEPDYVQSAALVAAGWLRHDAPAPSDGWMSLKAA
jgi:hypothetical protein